MSRVWIDFIHSQDILNSEVMFGDQLFRAKILADGLTTQSGIKASVDGVGRTYVLNLKNLFRESVKFGKWRVPAR